MYAGAYEPLNPMNHLRPFRPRWRSPLGELLCVLLPFLILSWGTAYKLSLYKNNQTAAPAKVCTRGSDAAKSGISQAIDAHKVIEHGAASFLPVDARFVPPEPHDVSLFATLQGFILPRSGPTLAARPPPIGFLFS